MFESRAGKHALVVALLVLAATLATSRPRKPLYVYPVAGLFALSAGWVAWRVKVAPPLQQSFPLGDPVAFIAAVPNHVASLADWARARGLSPLPASVAELDEWLWEHREALGSDWPSVLRGLVAAYGEALRADTPACVWLVRGGEPRIGSPRSLWPARRIFNEVHDAVFADV